MSPPKLTPQQKIESIKRRKEYQRNYHKNIPIELKRIYRKATTRYKENEHKQILKILKKSV